MSACFKFPNMHMYTSQVSVYDTIQTQTRAYIPSLSPSHRTFALADTQVTTLTTLLGLTLSPFLRPHTDRRYSNPDHQLVHQSQSIILYLLVLPRLLANTTRREPARTLHIYLYTYIHECGRKDQRQCARRMHPA